MHAGEMPIRAVFASTSGRPAPGQRRPAAPQQVAQLQVISMGNTRRTLGNGLNAPEGSFRSSDPMQAVGSSAYTPMTQSASSWASSTAQGPKHTGQHMQLLVDLATRIGALSPPGKQCLTDLHRAPLAAAVSSVPQQRQTERPPAAPPRLTDGQHMAGHIQLNVANRCLAAAHVRPTAQLRPNFHNQEIPGGLTCVGT